MAATTKWFGLAVKACTGKKIDWVNDTLKVTLHTSTMAPNQDTWDFRDDLTNELTTANGYTAGGVTIGSPTNTYDSASNENRLDGADSTWTFTGSVTFRYAVIQEVRGGASSADEVLGYIDFGTDQTVSGVFTIQYDATGVLKITAS